MSSYNVRVSRCDSDTELRGQMHRLGLPATQVGPAADAARPAILRIEGVSRSAAAVLGRSAAAVGCQVLVSRPRAEDGAVDVLVVASRSTAGQLVDVLRAQLPPDEGALAAEMDAALQHAAGTPAPLTMRHTTLHWGRRTYVMGVLNVTPDSFSGDGLMAAPDGQDLVDRAVARGLRFAADGADILDVGGESTRPGASPLDARTERSRVVPVISGLRRRTEALISVDTYKASVARAALEEGADLVNDVWGLQMDPGMARLVAERRVPVVIMHNRSKPKDAAQEARLGGRYVGVQYEDLLGDILRELRRQVAQARSAGVPPGHIIVDPGIGFGKTVSQNLYLLNHLDELRVLGYPILLGPSRKSFIGYTLDAPPEERMEGTAATVAVGIMHGADVVRVHDVREMVRVARMTDAMRHATLP